MNQTLWFTAPIAVLLAVAAGSGIFAQDLYRSSSPSIANQAIAQDYISLFLVLPVLLVTAWLASRGYGSARLVWLGTMIYLVYSYLTYAFAVAFNGLFLVYVTLFGCSLHALITGAVRIQKAKIQAAATERTPVKAISIFLAAMAVLFYLLWLSEVVPALAAGTVPPSAVEDRTPTNIVHVLDMAWILPAMLIAAIHLWRKQAGGPMLAGSLLTNLVLLIAAVLSMAVLDNPNGQPALNPQVILFGGIFAISLGMLIWLMKSLKYPAVQ